MEDKEMILEPEFKSNEEIRQDQTRSDKIRQVLALKLINERGFVRYKGFGLKKYADRYRLYLDCFPDEIVVELISYHDTCEVRGCKFSVPYTEDLGTLLIYIRSEIYNINKLHTIADLLGTDCLRPDLVETADALVKLFPERWTIEELSEEIYARSLGL